MTVSETSMLAYESIQQKLGKKQQIVFETIKELGAPTNERIAEFLGWPIQSVTGRVTELKRFGVIDVEGLGKNKSGHSAKKWSVRDLNDKNILDMAQDCEV